MSEITKTDNRSRDLVPSWIWICLTIFAVFTYFFGLTIPLVGPDEPRYAQVAREMFESGNWITPTLGGHTWFEKPALLYWFDIVAFTIFGVTEFAARLGPALFGLGTIASLWILGRAFATELTEKDEKQGSSPSVFSVHSVAGSFANWLALIAASTLGLIVFSRGSSFDIIVTFPLTAALVSFFLHDRSRRIPPLIAFYFFIGLALLAKGLIGVVFPYSIVALYFVLSRRMPSRTFVTSLLWGMPLALAVAATWYVPMYLQHGWTFVDEFFLQHHFQRFTSNKYQHPQPFYFFFWVLPLMTLPWLPFFLAAIWRFVRAIFQRTDTEQSKLSERSRSLRLFAIAWIAVPLLFFSFSGSKLPGYILPAVPPAIILTALFVTQMTEKQIWRYIVLSIAAATLATTAILLATVVPKFAEDDSIRSLIAAANERGLSESKVLTLHVVSHNAEFYAAGRLPRDENGKQKRFYGTGEIVAEVAHEGGKPALVLVPLEYQSQLLREERLRTEILKSNAETAIAVVSLK